MTTQEQVEREFYGRALAKTKEGPASTGYGLPVNQRMRFDMWAHQIEPCAVPNTETVLDVGSGTGDLLAYMDEVRIKPYRYLGVDIMSQMTDTAQKRWGGRDGVQFRTLDVARAEEWPWHQLHETQFDHVVSIAAYALKAPDDSQQENIAYVQDSIESMVSIANKTVFVTLFSTWKTNIIPEEMVLDPVTMFAWAKSKWERVDLIHSYCPFDFSLAIHLEKSDWRKAWEARSDD
jgi:SAM-dependent methyltransferase